MLTCRAQKSLYAKLAAGGSSSASGKVGAGTIAGIMVAAAVVAAAVGLAVHKLRMRHVMQSEIRAVMREYMPLVTPRAMKLHTVKTAHDLISSACSVHAPVPS